MNLVPFWQALQSTKLGDFVATNDWAFPTIETLHVMAIVTVVGTILVMDLRLVGVASKNWAVTKISEDTLPYTWGAFVLAMITGSLLFMAKADTYTRDPWFIWKMIMIVVAGVNMAVFHLFTWKSVHHWDTAPEQPIGAKIAGGLSLFFWVVVVFCARAIGFTLSTYQQ